MDRKDVEDILHMLVGIVNDANAIYEHRMRMKHHARICHDEEGGDTTFLKKLLRMYRDCEPLKNTKYLLGMEIEALEADGAKWLETRMAWNEQDA